MNVLVPFGTRPEIIKLAPVVRALRARDFDVRTVMTGQQADAAMTDAFLEKCDLRPDVRWCLDGHDDSRVGAMLSKALTEIADSRPDVVLLLGDTYTVPMFCLAARRNQVPVAHLEAGLRSFNETSMEEVNRRVAAATASLHLAPTQLAARFLRRDGVDAKRVHVVGNPVLDALRLAGTSARPVGERCGILVTAHRATNVDQPERLARLVDIVVRTAREIGPVTFPVHPRTRARLEAAGALRRLEQPGITLLPPLPYEEMLTLVATSQVVLTDSGGLQEEASWFGVPIVVLRRSTPRWEGIAAGTAVLAGLEVEPVLDATRRFIQPGEQTRVAATPCPYGDGHTGARVAGILDDPATCALLRLDEPDFVGQAIPR